MMTSSNSDEINSMRWESLVNQHVNLEPQDLIQAKEIKNPEDLKSKLQDSSAQHQTSQVVLALYPYITQLGSLSSTFLGMTNGIVDVSILWGVLFMDLRLLLEFNESMLVISRYCNTIGTKLQYFNEFRCSAENAHVKKDALFEVHTELLILFAGIYKPIRDDPSRIAKTEKTFRDAISNIESRFSDLERTEQLKVANLNNENHRNTLASQKKLISAEIPGMGAILPCFDTLPPPPNRFFGRDDDLEKIHEILAPSTPGLRSIAIYGLGGVGKTQIALSYAYRHRSLKTFEAILWVNSETSLSLASSFTRIAIVLGIPKARSLTDAENRVLVLSELQKISSPWLLIFDNAEEPSLLQSFWPTTNHGSVLVTSRNHILALDPASGGLEIETFSEEQGADFLLSHFPPQHRSIKVEQEAALNFSQRLGGHALAINQMAALMIHKGLTISEFSVAYDKRTKHIHRERRQGQKSPGYPHYLDTVWKMSFDTLSEPKHASSFAMLGVLSLTAPDLIPQDLFRYASNLPKSLDFCEDAYSLSEPMELLFRLSLMKKSVEELSSDSAMSMLSLHRLVQTEFGYYVDDTVRQEMFTNATKLLSNAFPKQVNGRPMRKVWPTCALYISHVIALAECYNSSTGITPTSEFCWLISYAAWYLKEYGSVPQVRFLIDVGFKAYEECLEKDKLVHLHLSNSAGVLNLERGYFTEAWGYLKTCEKSILEIFGPDHEETSSIYNNLGLCSTSMGDNTGALRYLELAAKMMSEDTSATPEERSENVAAANIVLGRAHWILGDHVSAAACCQKAVEYYEVSEDDWYLSAHSHYAFAGVHRTNLDLGKAKESYERCQKLMDDHSAHLHPFMPHIIYKLGCLEMDGGNYELAVTYLTEALSIAELISLSPGEISRISNMLGNALSKSGGKDNEAAAASAYNRAIELRKEVQKVYNASDQSERAYDMLVAVIYW